MLDWVLRYIRLGWGVIPLHGKKPYTNHGLKDWTLSEEQARAWWTKWPNANIGLVTGHRFFVIDIDAHRGGEDTWDSLRSKHPPLPATIESITGRGGRHIFYKLPENFRVSNSEDFIGPGIDVRGHGGYVVAPPSIHPDTHVAYNWDGAAELESQEISEAPQWLLNVLHGQGKRRRAKTLSVKIVLGGRNDTLFREGCRLRRVGWSEGEIFSALKILNAERCEPPLLDDELHQIAGSAAKYPPAESSGPTPARSPRTAIAAAVADDHRIEQPLRRGKVFSIDRGRASACWPDDPIGSPPSMPVGNLVAPRALLPCGTALDLNDTGNAERLRIIYGNDLLWCHEFQEWLVFHSGVWERGDDLARVMASRVIAMTKFQADRAEMPAVAKFSAKSGDVQRIRGMLIMNQEHLGISVKELDQRAELLAFRNGTVDLRTGEMREGLREDYITKRVPHDYDPGASCPRFLQFLDEIMGGGPDVGSEEAQDRAARMVDALQVFLGYSITGTTIAKTVFIHIGEGGNNGKTTLLDTIRYALGADHSVLLKIDSLMQQRGAESSNASADLADLQGVRFANTSEVEKGKRLDEAKLKSITQGMGLIRGCRKYENPFSFIETHKLHIDSNHWPRIHADDNPLWDRLCCIPYERHFEPHEQDKELPAKLRSDAKGVLVWLVRGAQRFYAAGQRLPRPAEVVKAVEAYRVEMDIAAQFFEERCEFGASLSVTSAAIYGAYRAWATANGAFPILAHKDFSQRLAAKEGVEIKHTKHGNHVRGVTLVSDESAALGFGEGEG